MWEKILERKISPGGKKTEEDVLHLELVEEEQVTVLLEVGGVLGGGVGWLGWVVETVIVRQANNN